MSPAALARARSTPARASILTWAAAVPVADSADPGACSECLSQRSHALGWNGPELVCRAVHLILDGALDGRTETHLGAQLGVSSRHLRRLFAAHLGTTPGGLARSARARSARRLLDETDSTVLEIALSTGFGSVRQLNRVCRQLFGASPRALRQARGIRDRSPLEDGLTLRLSPHRPLDWPAVVAFLSERAIPGVECVSGQVYRRTIVVGEEPGAIELRPGDAGHLLLTTRLPRWQPLVHVVERARRIPNLVVEPIVRTRLACLPGVWDPFEAGVAGVLGNDLSAAVARTIVGRVVERLGNPVAGFEQLGLTHVFPTAERISTAELSALGIPVSRAEAVRAYAKAISGRSCVGLAA